MHNVRNIHIHHLIQLKRAGQILKTSQSPDPDPDPDPTPAYLKAEPRRAATEHGATHVHRPSLGPQRRFDHVASLGDLAEQRLVLLARRRVLRCVIISVEEVGPVRRVEAFDEPVVRCRLLQRVDYCGVCAVGGEVVRWWVVRWWVVGRCTADGQWMDSGWTVDGQRTSWMDSWWWMVGGWVAH